MATPKTITLNDLQIGKIILQMADDGSAILHVEGVYRFLDEGSIIVEEIEPRRVKRSIPWSQIPVNIQNSIVAIRDFLYASALADEDME